VKLIKNLLIVTFILLCGMSLYISCSGKTAEYYIDKGYEYIQENNYEMAIQNFTEAIRLDPNYYLAYSWRGLIYYFEDKLDEAIIDFDQSIRLNPSSYDLRWRGEALHQRGAKHNQIEDYELAILDLEAALQAFPDDEKIKNTLSSARIGHRTLAREIERANLVPGTREYIAEEHYQRGKVYAYQNWDNRFSESSSIKEMILSSLLFHGDLDKAISEWETALRLDPNHYEARSDLEQARNQRGY